MPTMVTKDCAIFTICIGGYLIGTEVLLYSFLRHNRDFRGKILLLLEQPDNEIFARLKFFPNVEFLYPSPELMGKLNSLAKHLPAMKPHLIYFYCFELFRLENFKTIIYLDSDILCRKDISELFAGKIDFGACGDRSYYDPSLDRSIESFKLIKMENAANQILFDFPFNAGVLVVGKKYLNEGVYGDLLDLISPAVFANRWMRFADQIVLNLYFDKRINHLSAKFNYNITLQEAWIWNKDSIGPEEAALIHYASSNKPWHILFPNFNELVHLSDKWLNEYNQYLSERALVEKN